jgi:hypothetical protein
VRFDEPSFIAGCFTIDDRTHAVEDQMARSGMGKDKVRGYPHTGGADAEMIDELAVESDAQGRKRLQGNDQKNVRNQRPDMPDELKERPKGPAQPRDIPGKK